MAVAAAVQLAACDKKSAPTGQVAALVNGVEITTSELEAEAMATGADLRQPAARKRVLDVVIERHLQAAAATQKGLDKDPRFLAERRRAEQLILSQMYLMSTRAQVDDADVGEARMFILHNPALFEERQLLVFDRVGYAPANALPKEEIEGVKSLAEAERLLLSKGIRPERRAATLDPADVPSEIVRRLPEIENGQVFFAVQGAGAMFAAIVDRKPAPVPTSEHLARARSILKRQKTQEAVQSAVEGLRKNAKITYQKGFGPAGEQSKAALSQGKE